MTKNYTLEELSESAKSIIEASNSKVLLLKGKMGVGKTTLIKELVKELGSSDTVSSPTFSLVNEYHSTDGSKIYHFDFYRIEEEEEAMDMGIEEYLYSDSWCLIEWPEKVENLLPLNAVTVHITEIDENQRTFELINHE